MPINVFDPLGIRAEDERRRAIVAQRNALARQADPNAEQTPFRSGLSRIGATLQNIPSNILGTPRATTDFAPFPEGAEPPSAEQLAAPFSQSAQQQAGSEPLAALREAALGAGSSEEFAAILGRPDLFPDPAAPQSLGFDESLPGRPSERSQAPIPLGFRENLVTPGGDPLAQGQRGTLTVGADELGVDLDTGDQFRGPVSPAGVTAAARAASPLQEFDPNKNVVRTATGDVVLAARPEVVQVGLDTAIYLLGEDGLKKAGAGPISPIRLEPGVDVVPGGITGRVSGQPRLTTLPTEANLAQTGAGGATGVVATGQDPTKILGVGDISVKGPKIQAEGWKPITILSPGELALQVDKIVAAGLPIADNSNAELFKIETPLRDSFLKQTKSFRALGQQFAVIAGVFRGEVAPHEVFLRNAKGATSAARDMAMIFGIMKMLDPTSVVRESEQATARNARGVPAGIRARWNQLLSGEQLDETQRRDFMDVAIDIYEAQGVTYKATESEFRKLAVLYGARPEAVTPNLLGQSGPSLEPRAPQQQAPTAPSDAAITASAAALGFNVDDMTDQQFAQAQQHAQGAR